MQRVDVLVDGKAINVNQRSDLPALWTRIHNAAQTASVVVIQRHGVNLPPPPTTPPPKPANLLAGQGTFTAWDSNAANGLALDWVALQADPEGGPHGYTGKARRLVWQARPDTNAMLYVQALGAVGYIGQAEGPQEFLDCMRVSELITVPKYLVGKPDDWVRTVGDGSIQAAVNYAKAHGWGLLIEWYWNDQNALNEGPNSYGMEVDACLFGCFDGKEARKFLAQYLAIWKGSFGTYTAETLNADERALMASKIAR